MIFLLIKRKIQTIKYTSSSEPLKSQLSVAEASVAGSFTCISNTVANMLQAELSGSATFNSTQNDVNMQQSDIAGLYDIDSAAPAIMQQSELQARYL